MISACAGENKESSKWRTAFVFDCKRIVWNDCLQWLRSIWTLNFALNFTLNFALNLRWRASSAWRRSFVFEEEATGEHSHERLLKMPHKSECARDICVVPFACDLRVQHPRERWWNISIAVVAPMHLGCTEGNLQAPLKTAKCSGYRQGCIFPRTFSAKEFLCLSLTNNPKEARSMKSIRRISRLENFNFKIQNFN